MSQLNVPYFKQENSLSCGIACLRVIFGYFGDNVTEKELSKGVKIHSFGTYTTDLGAIALKRGYKVKIYTFHLRLLSPLKISFGTKITERILDSLKVSLGDKQNMESWKHYLKLGGELIWDTPKIRQVRDILGDKIPCLVNVNTSALNKFWKNWDNGHYLTVIGTKDNSIVVSDPDPWDQNIYEINDEIFLPSWSINAKLSTGHLMVIKK